MNDRVGEALHLVRRFFGHLRAKPLGPDDQRFVHAHLQGRCAELFWKQCTPDQRHAVDVARRAQDSLPGDVEVIEAALLHDVGKQGAGIGAISRSIATVLDALHLPMTNRMRLYRDHGEGGATDLEDAGCGPFAVAFARHHPSPAPEGFDPERWQALLDADG
ncbi:MAG: hypothetical protein ABFR89_08860 [Actinomycetota bacterium]